MQLSGRGYGVLPDLEWGLDDTTIARFEHDMGVQLPVDGPDRFALRQQLLTGEYADQWRDWRAARVTEFYQRLAQLVAASGGRTETGADDRRPAGEFDRGRAKLRPNVVAKPRLDRTMLDMGIDWQALGNTPGIVVLPTRYVESMVPLVDRALDLSINEGFLTVEKPSPAALFYHRPQRQSFPSFDALRLPLPPTPNC